MSLRLMVKRMNVEGYKIAGEHAFCYLDLNFYFKRAFLFCPRLQVTIYFFQRYDKKGHDTFY